eukprot:GHVR01008424.1.p1 GENE.GHVR01008424.1~~GHVR01008424.1.p1  ORF type:complete len:286 (+),score=103.67 GHVR01008424.1:86-943(+)
MTLKDTPVNSTYYDKYYYFNKYSYITKCFVRIFINIKQFIVKCVNTPSVSGLLSAASLLQCVGIVLKVGALLCGRYRFYIPTEELKSSLTAYADTSHVYTQALSLLNPHTHTNTHTHTHTWFGYTHSWDAYTFHQFEDTIGCLKSTEAWEGMCHDIPMLTQFGRVERMFAVVNLTLLFLSTIVSIRVRLQKHTHTHTHTWTHSEEGGTETGVLPHWTLVAIFKVAAIGCFISHMVQVCANVSLSLFIQAGASLHMDLCVCVCACLSLACVLSCVDIVKKKQTHTL